MTQTETNAAVKVYADAMERGWNKCPVMIKDRFWTGFNPRNPDACCANGHAALGSEWGNANNWYEFEKTVQHIRVKLDARFGDNNTTNLPGAIDILVNDGWTTPQIIK